MERSMLQYLVLYLFWDLMNSAISPWTLPIIFHATGAWPKARRTWNTASSSRSKQKTNSKPGFNSSCKSRGTRGLLLPWKPSFLLPFSVRPDLCPGWEFRAFKPNQTPLFSRPPIPGLEMCFQISTTPAGLVVKAAWKLGLNTKRELAFPFLPKPSDLTPLFLFPLYFFPSPRISGLAYEALNI